MQNTSKPTPIEQLANFAFDLVPGQIPDVVQKQARLCVLDTLGCMIAGSRTKEASALLEVEHAAHHKGDSTVAGSSRRLPSDAAARVNAYMGDIFELNDLISGHASIGVVSAALAEAERLGRTVEDLILAVVAGIEVTARVYNAFYPHLKPLSQSGIVSVGMPSTIGSAAAVSRLLGLTRKQTTEALAVAAALANWCPAEVLFGSGGSVKPMMFGAMPASAGINGAKLAQAGMSGPWAILDSPIGYFSGAATQWDETAITSAEWALKHPRRKLHACCGYIHSAFEAIVEARQQNSLEIDDVERVVVTLPAYIVPAVSKKGEPASENEARFHLQYILALAIDGLNVVRPGHSAQYFKHLARPAISSVIPKISVQSSLDLTHYHQAQIEIYLADGRVVNRTNNRPKGSPSNPLTDDEVEEKYLSLASPVLGSGGAVRLRDAILDLDQKSGLGQLVGAFSLANDAESEAQVIA